MIDLKHFTAWERLFVEQAAAKPKSSAPMPEIADNEAVNSDAAVVAVKLLLY